MPHVGTGLGAFVGRQGSGRRGSTRCGAEGRVGAEGRRMSNTIAMPIAPVARPMPPGPAPSASTAAAKGEPMVVVDNLTVKFVTREATVSAVNGVSLTIDRGEVLCIIGESG